MASAFSYKIEGLEKLQALFKKLPRQLARELKDEMFVTATEVSQWAKRDAPKDENMLGRSISPKREPGLSSSVVAQKGYAGFVEFGTKSKTVVPPGLESVASQFKGATGVKGTDPIVALTKWVRRKGLADTYSVTRYNIATRSGVRRSRGKAYKKREQSVAYAIWMHIKRFGIKAQPFFFKQMEPAKKLINQRLAAVLKRVVNNE